ncbi:PAS domain-containing protein [Pontibacter anaerobius]|uniref:histidine kinase n=1 Tax=Pontibacter anaerobius TaxID=2993940 RepID=A0ABT3RHS2_9BACT|nr:PAS domain-containing protein [Pontibacter anaerobius]MCX2740917.1 PAS domain-containing protein [Pontibacter anaerobius]
MTKPVSLSPEVLRAFETLPDPYLILSPEFTILTASKAYLELSLRNLADIQGKYVLDVFPDNPSVTDCKATAMLKSSLQWAVEHKQVHTMPCQRYDLSPPNSPEVFTEKYWQAVNTPVADTEGNIQYIIHKVEDITAQELAKKNEVNTKIQLEKLYGEQAQTQVQLIAARADAELERMKLYNLLMQTPAMFCIFEGPQHVFKFVNPPYQGLVGDRPLLGRPIAEAMPELEGQSVLHLLDQVYSTGESVYAFETKVQLDHDNDGNLGNNYYNFTYQAVRNLDGDIDGIMVFAYEVTVQVNARREVEQREQTLKTLNEQLEAANREIEAAYAELSQTQQALQQLNKELEERIATRTRELERSKATTELQRNRLHMLFMDAPIPFLILDGPEHVFQLVNPSFQKIFPGRDLVGKTLLEALPELEGTPIPNILHNVYTKGETYEGNEFPLMLARHEGAEPEEIIFTFTYQPRIDEEGKVDGVLVYVQDVTEQVKARQVVEQSAQQLQLITDSLPVLIGYLDKDEKYRFANKAYEAWFPMKSEDLIGRPVREIVGEKAYQGVKQYIDRALAGERLDFKSKMPYRENFIKYINTSYVPDIREGKVAGFYTLVNDITEQVQNLLQIEEREKEAQALTKKLAATNEELIAANEQLLRTNLDLDNFIYTASHDLKAPIYNIEGLVQVLLESVTTNALPVEETERVRTMIEGSISRFKNTIEHLTEIVKLQKENSQEAVEIDLAEVIHDVVLDLNPQLEAANASLTLDVHSPPPIRFSHKNLRSIVYNLLSNAIKYSSPERTPEIALTCYPDGEFNVITVSDNGLGFNKAGSQKLFSMFGRLHDHVEGSGIGLYMVKKIIENAAGRIEVESEPGVGSTFKVYLKN